MTKTISISLSENVVNQLDKVKQALKRHKTTDCIRYLIEEKYEKILPLTTSIVVNGAYNKEKTHD